MRKVFGYPKVPWKGVSWGLGGLSVSLSWTLTYQVLWWEVSWGFGELSVSFSWILKVISGNMSQGFENLRQQELEIQRVIPRPSTFQIHQLLWNLCAMLLGQCQAEKVCSTPVWESFRFLEFWRHQQLSKLSAFDRPRWITVHQIMIVRTLRGWIRDVLISSKEKGECFAPHPPFFSFQKEVLHVSTFTCFEDGIFNILLRELCNPWFHQMVHFWKLYCITKFQMLQLRVWTKLK